MKRKCYHSFLIMPSAPGKRVFKFTLPTYVWGLLCLLPLAVSVWAGAATWTIYRLNETGNRYRELENENEAARAQLQDRTKEVNYLNQQLDQIREKAGFIEKFLGLESTGEAEGNIGQGGEEVPVPPEGYSEAVKPPRIVKAALTTPIQVDRLSEDLGRIIQRLKKNQDELEHTPSISPIDPKEGWISSGFGTRVSPFTGKKQLHLGVDLAGCKGAPIIATANGKVLFAGRKGAMGLTIEIKHNRRFKTAYGHLLKTAVKKGQYVKRGEVIGYMGNTGRSTGYHVHYSVKKNDKHINPFYHMMDWKTNTTLFAAAEETD